MTVKDRRIREVVKYIIQLEPGLIYAGILMSILNAVKPFIMLFVSKVLIDAVLVQANYDILLRKILSLLFVYFIMAALEGFLEKRVPYYLEKFNRKHEMQKANHLLEIPYAWTEEDETQERMAELISMEKRNVFGFWSFTRHVHKASGSVVGIIISISIVADIFSRKVSPWGIPAEVFDWGFLIIFIAIFAATLWLVAWVSDSFGKLIGSGGGLMRYLRTYTALIYQYKSGKDIRLFSKNLADNYTNIYRDYMAEIYTNMSNLLTRNLAIESLMEGLSNACLYFYIAIKALYGGIAISEILLFMGAFTYLTRFAMELIDSLSTNNAGDLYRVKLLEYYDLGSDEKFVPDNSAPTQVTVTEAPHCQIKNLSFNYPGSEKTVLQDISFDIRLGEKLAIVGENGSGKTTLIKVLIGLYKDFKGEIWLGDKNAREISKQAIGEVFSPVFQDFRLLALTLEDNVTCFREFPEETIKETLKRVGMEEFYNTHGPDAYLTKNFASSGVEISGGEAQKIAMARAMLKNSPIFVLDEPTAALDPISERDIYEKFNEIIQGKTAIFISHRLSSCKFCDRILVLDQGRLVQMGSHDELVGKSGGKYKELWDAQAHHYIQ